MNVIYKMLSKTIIELPDSPSHYKLAILYVLINRHILKAIEDAAIEQTRSANTWIQLLLTLQLSQ